ncbi:retrovirus-related pol polyprotein from transposon TNT 1-94 [Tanacetum coccineum]
MEAIRIFLAFATYMNFKVYQMDVKSSFLNGKLKKEVYVKQSPGFESSEFPDYVCKLNKAFYGLKQAPRACPMCKISDQSKRVTSNSCEKNPQLPERKKAPHVPAKYLVENWYVGVPRNSSQWLCPQLKLNMFLGAIIYNDLVTKLLNKSRLKYVSYPSKVTDIELTAHMIVVNNQKDSVSLLPLATKPKKGKSQTVTQTLPKSQGSEVPGALSKKRKRPKSKNPPTKTKVTPPRPTKGSEQSYSVSLGTVHDPQDLERNIQLASMGLPSILDARPRGNITTSDMGTTTPPVADLSGTGELDTQPIVLSTYADVRAFLLSDDESEEDIFGADKPRSSHASSTEASNTDSSIDNILRKYDNILPFTERQLVKYLRKMSNAMFTRIFKDNWEKHEEAVVNYADLKASIIDYYDENIAHRDHTDKLVEASMSSLDKSSNTISDLYKGLNIITELLKEIKNAVKDDSAHALKQDEELAAWAKSSTNMA